MKTLYIVKRARDTFWVTILKHPHVIVTPGRWGFFHRSLYQILHIPSPWVVLLVWWRCFYQLGVQIDNWRWGVFLLRCHMKPQLFSDHPVQENRPSFLCRSHVGTGTAAVPGIPKRGWQHRSNNKCSFGKWHWSCKKQIKFPSKLQAKQTLLCIYLVLI